jgi:hypothetical protein
MSQRTTVDLPNALHAAVKSAAALGQMPMREYITETLRERIERKDNSQCRYRAYYSTQTGVLAAVVVDSETESVCFWAEMKPGQTKHDALELASRQAGLMEVRDATK